MKTLLVIILSVFIGKCGQAQTFDEWFRQKKTQRKYLIQQIAALRVYAAYVQKGYSIAKKGLSTIGSIKDGEFGLHKDFFTSLKTVNPKIKDYAKVAAIIALQLQIVRVYKELTKEVRVKDRFTAAEAKYIVGVLESLLNECEGLLVELYDVILPAKLQMKDDERLSRIDAVYGGMNEAYTFAQAFAAETKLLGLQRLKEELDVHTSRVLNDVKNK